MKKMHIVGMGLVGVMLMGGWASAARILIAENIASGVKGDGNYYNGGGTTSSAAALRDSGGNATGVTMTHTAFSYKGNNGILSSVISSYPSDVTPNWRYVKAGTSIASLTVTFANLTPNGHYDITFYGSYTGAGDHFTDITINSVTQQYNAGGTADEGKTTFNSAAADGSGNLAFTIAPSSGGTYGFLNVVDISSVVPEPATLGLLAAGGMVLAIRRRRK